MNTPIDNINMNNNKGSQQPNISIQQPNSSNKINMNNLVNQNQPETHSDNMIMRVYLQTLMKTMNS